ncbi:hypothetical protein [Croceivirga radicis]|uniref:hypothetical protein n=1 Tax=Croceivirga radicis TaxID=1929488 RepID=UPI000255AFE6|nr:hypothetical protein [Croceivirga radicis]
MRIWNYLSLISWLFLQSCNGQETGKTEKPLQDSKNDTGNWSVSKEYDDYGNLISYDSVYTWASSPEITKGNKDSILQQLQHHFYKRFHGMPSGGNEFLNEKDSLLISDFFNDDFFESEFGKEFMQLDKLHEQLWDKHRNFFEKYGLTIDRDSTLIF